MKDYYKILKVDRNATSGEIRDAYLKLAKECHPDKLPREGDVTTANEEFTLISEAYRVLTNQKKRQKYDQDLLNPAKAISPETQAGKVQAETSFRHGFLALEKSDFPRAETYFRAAVELNSEVPKYKSYLGLAIASQGKSIKEAESYCREAIQMEIYNPVHYVNLGVVYRIAGNRDKAKAQFEQALAWDPRNPRARQELEDLRGKKGRGLKKLFKKRG